MSLAEDIRRLEQVTMLFLKVTLTPETLTPGNRVNH